jgi:hypothetical protein
MVVMVMTVVVMVPFFRIGFRATCLMQGFAELSVDQRHGLYSFSNMVGKRRLPFVGHSLSPFFEFFDMSFIVLYPVLQHNTQFLNIIHFFSN